MSSESLISLTSKLYKLLRILDDVIILLYILLLSPPSYILYTLGVLTVKSVRYRLVVKKRDIRVIYWDDTRFSWLVTDINDVLTVGPTLIYILQTIFFGICYITA